MPADADILCEHFMLSSFNKHKKFKSSNTESNQFSSSQKVTHLNQTTSSNESSFFNDTIDFVKYEKNPMDYLKSKYQLLNNKPAVSHAQSNMQIKPRDISNAQDETNKAKSIFTSQKNTTDNLDLNWYKIRKQGIGLLNLGNNCYLNATLQCLAYTPPLSQWLITRPHSSTCKFKQTKGFCSLCEVERIIFDIFNSANGYAKPNSLCYNIKKISNVFSVGTQEDASEFFTTLLESMAKSIKYTLNILNHQNGIKNAKKINTIFDDIFSFQFRSRITCGNCGRLSDTIENTNTWPVDVKYAQDIRKGMLHFLREEVLEGPNAYKCEKCNKKTRATKKYSIRTAPNILVIHLKRFDFSYAGKLSHFVTYPEMLSFKTFVPETKQSNMMSTSTASAAALVCMNSTESGLSSNEKSLRNVSYKLYGVLVHLGYTSHSGHYYSYVRGPNESWYRADDQRVSAVQTKDALSQKAYILFYSKITNSHLDKTSINESKSESILNTPKKTSNIPNIIRSEPNKNEITNYLNSLISKPVNGIPKMNEKCSISSNLSVNLLKTSNSLDKPIKNEELKSKLEKETKKKSYEKLTIKKLRKLIIDLKNGFDEESMNKDEILKNKRKLKKLRRILREKKQNSNENNINKNLNLINNTNNGSNFNYKNNNGLIKNHFN